MARTSCSCKTQFFPSFYQGIELRLRVHDRVLDRSAQLPPIEQQPVRTNGIESQHLRDRVGEGDEAASHEDRPRPADPHRPDQSRGAGVRNDPFRQAAADRFLVEPGKERHALAKRCLEVQLALHGALGDLRDLALEAGEIGKLIEAFLADDGRIHVGDEQALEPVLLGLNEDVHAIEPVERPTDRLDVPKDAQVDRIALVDPG